MASTVWTVDFLIVGEGKILCNVLCRIFAYHFLGRLEVASLESFPCFEDALQPFAGSHTGSRVV